MKSVPGEKIARPAILVTFLPERHPSYLKRNRIQNRLGHGIDIGKTHIPGHCKLLEFPVQPFDHFREHCGPRRICAGIPLQLRGAAYMRNGTKNHRAAEPRRQGFTVAAGPGVAEPLDHRLQIAADGCL